MNYLSVCSGIEAASVAWHDLGLEPIAFAEIEAFPSAVLAHRFPDVPNLGDFTTIGANYGPVDVLVGGTPCQSFSVAGKRLGLSDSRGNLAIEFCKLARRVRARWIVWENVPGVLSSWSDAEAREYDEGGYGAVWQTNDFDTFLALLGECGYQCAWRVLDAQHFGVPQRRRRVFVVGYLGDWRPPAAVLFEPEGVRRNPSPRRASREGVAGTLGGGSGERGWCDDTDRMTFVPEVAGTLRSGDDSFAGMKGGAALVAGTLQANSGRCRVDTPYVAHSLRADGFDASEDGTGRGTPLVTHILTRRCGAAEEDGTGRGTLIVPAVAFSCKDCGGDVGEIAPTLRSMDFDGSHANGGGQLAVAFDTTQISSPTNRCQPQAGDPCHPLAAQAHPPAVAFALRGREGGAIAELGDDKANALRAAQGGSDKAHVLASMAVRRLTPRECERLQGFPDDWTLVPYNGKPAKDGPRYCAIGNSMAVPVMRWIGARLVAVEAILHDNGKRDAPAPTDPSPPTNHPETPGGDGSDTKTGRAVR
jgi:DNA (cytosine-5)-methyltransferase 1